MFYKKLKDVAAVLVIVFLLPYVVVILASGMPEHHGSVSQVTGQAVCVEYDNYREMIPRDQYLVGALAAQIPVGYHMEALKAQAVVVRTCYMLHERDRVSVEPDGDTQPFLSKEQMKNLWGDDFQTNYKKLEQAVVDTANDCLYHNGQLCEPYFHAVSAGETRDGCQVFGSEEYGYLACKVCEKDMLADGYVTMKTFSHEELEELLETELVLTSGQAAGVQVLETDQSGYVTRMQVGQQQMHGELFRKKLQLPSAAFQMEVVDSGLRFVCKGLGHGLGMSLYTANELAQQGNSYREILEYFYKKTTLEQQFE